MLPKTLSIIRLIYKNKFVKITFTFLAILFAVGVLGYLIYREREILFAYTWEINPTAVLGGFILYLIDLLLVVWVWSLIVNQLGYPLGYWRHFRKFTIANIARRLPGTMWYVLSRGQVYQQNGTPVKLTTLASGLEVIITVISGVLVSICFASPTLLLYPTGSVVLVCLILIASSLLHPKILGWFLRRLNVEIATIRYRTILLWILIYCFVWVIGGSLLFCVANILTEVSLSYLGYFIGIWTLVGVLSTTIMLLPSNFGFTEIGLSLLLAVVMPSSIAVIVAILARILVLFFEIVMASISWAIDLQEKRV